MRTGPEKGDPDCASSHLLPFQFEQVLRSEFAHPSSLESTASATKTRFKQMELCFWAGAPNMSILIDALVAQWHDFHTWLQGACVQVGHQNTFQNLLTHSGTRRIESQLETNQTRQCTGEMDGSLPLLWPSEYIFPALSQRPTAAQSTQPLSRVYIYIYMFSRSNLWKPQNWKKRSKGTPSLMPPSSGKGPSEDRVKQHSPPWLGPFLQVSWASLAWVCARGAGAI